MDTTAKLEAYSRAQARLLDLIRGDRRGPVAAARGRERSREKLSATRRLLTGLGNPQCRFPTVHVTGTSGKGSTAVMIAAMLAAAGYRVGLRTSPYLQVATEKLQVGSVLIDALEFDELSGRVLQEHDRLVASGRIYTPLGYAEIWSALTFLWLQEAAVDIAVIEVGAGGRFDSTNVIDPVVSVITNVGLDHVESLGPTVADIAWHKAGLIKPGSTAVIGAVPAAAWTVIANEAASSSAEVIRVPGETPRSIRQPIMPGDFQRANAAVAMSAITALESRGFPTPQTALTLGLAAARLPCRLERMPFLDNPTVWLDGAHNADKIAALASEVALVSGSGPLPIVVLGVLATKDAHAIVSGLAPNAAAIVATEPSVVGRRSLPAQELAVVVQAAGYLGPLRVEPDPTCALQEAEAIANQTGSSVLVTGSMYLAGHVRRRWFPDAQIVTQQTPWPKLDANASLHVP